MFFSVKKEISHRMDNVDPYTVIKSKKTQNAFNLKLKLGNPQMLEIKTKTRVTEMIVLTLGCVRHRSHHKTENELLKSQELGKESIWQEKGVRLELLHSLEPLKCYLTCEKRTRNSFHEFVEIGSLMFDKALAGKNFTSGNRNPKELTN